MITEKKGENKKMTSKKDALAQEAQKSKSVIDDIAQTPEEKKKAEEMKANMTTRGNHVGVHLPRINVAFSSDNYDYLRVMSALKGISLTAYINDLVDDDREKHSATYKKAVKLADEMKEGTE